MLSNYYYWRYLFWGELLGVIFLVAGLMAVRKQLSRKPQDWPVLGRVFVAVPLALFGMGHLVAARLTMELVPVWMPWRLFWTYFTGLAEIAAAASFLSMKLVRWSGWLLGIMFLCFVFMIHLPDVVKIHDRIRWAVMTRDLIFGIGGWALAATQIEERSARAAQRVIAFCRTVFGVVLVFYAVEHFLHPKFALGIPLELPTPAWVPLPSLWGYLVGAMLLVAGLLLLVNRQARDAATWLGVAITVVVLLYYSPLIFPAKLPSQLNMAVDYVADTLLFAGAIFLMAGALPTQRSSAAQ